MTPTLIESVRQDVQTGLSELHRCGRTRLRRAEDVLAYFDRTRIGNGPTEAINGRLDQLRDSALGVRNLTDRSPGIP
ncbi:Transposase IS204/IS1001/IS1096/IS1165 DDE domain-containing protein [Stackebrandtia soli]